MFGPLLMIFVGVFNVLSFSNGFGILISGWRCEFMYSGICFGVSGGFGLAGAGVATAAEAWLGEERPQQVVLYDVLSTPERSESKDGSCLRCCRSVFLKTYIFTRF